MNNLSFEDLKNLSVSVADNSLLEKISGGTADDCHDDGGIDYSGYEYYAPCDNI